MPDLVEDKFWRAVRLTELLCEPQGLCTSAQSAGNMSTDSTTTPETAPFLHVSTAVQHNSILQQQVLVMKKEKINEPLPCCTTMHILIYSYSIYISINYNLMCVKRLQSTHANEAETVIVLKSQKKFVWVFVISCSIGMIHKKKSRFWSNMRVILFSYIVYR